MQDGEHDTGDGGLAARIERIEAEAAIVRLVHDYALAIRRDTVEQVADLFVPEGTFEVRSGHPDRKEHVVRTRFASPAELVAFLLSQKGNPHPVPMICNFVIDVDGDTAHASSMMTAPIYGTDKHVMGEYADNFVRRDGAWRFLGRIYTVYAG